MNLFFIILAIYVAVCTILLVIDTKRIKRLKRNLRTAKLSNIDLSRQLRTPISTFHIEGKKYKYAKLQWYQDVNKRSAAAFDEVKYAEHQIARCLVEKIKEIGCINMDYVRKISDHPDPNVESLRIAGTLFVCVPVEPLTEKAQ